MELTDASGKPLQEVTVRLSGREVTDLLVAASEMDDGTRDHTVIRDQDGSLLAVYLDRPEAGPIEKAMDWWVGPIVLLAVVLVVIGAFTVARGLLRLLF
ncbi:MAG: hypothetical protein ACRDIU_04360 [Actinomycetota bacterium]